MGWGCRPRQSADGFVRLSVEPVQWGACSSLLVRKLAHGGLEHQANLGLAVPES